MARRLGVQSTAVLTIIKSPTSVWKLAYFGANANNPAIAGDAADPAQDGIVNLLAYAYAFDPLIANTNPFTGRSSEINSRFISHATPRPATSPTFCRLPAR